MRDFRSDRARRWTVVRPAPAVVSGGALGSVSAIEVGLEPNRIAQVEALELRREQSAAQASRKLMTL
jgi:hypothetical protein